MVHALPLHQMTPVASLEGTVVSWESLHNSEIEQCIQEAMEVNIITFEFPILGHPVMLSEPGFIEMVCLFPISFPSRPSSTCLVLSARTCSWFLRLSLQCTVVEGRGCEGGELCYGQKDDEEEG
jgi:hypothetical protein